MKSDSNFKCYVFYFENEKGEECNEIVKATALDKAKEVFISSNNKEIIKISEFPKHGEGSTPNVVYHRDCD